MFLVGLALSLVAATAKSGFGEEVPDPYFEHDPAGIEALAAFMESTGLQPTEVEKRFFEAFEYESDRVYVRPFVDKHIFFYHGIRTIYDESLQLLRDTAAQFSSETGADITLELIDPEQFEEVASNPFLLPRYILFEKINGFPTQAAAERYDYEHWYDYYLPFWPASGGLVRDFGFGDVTGMQAWVVERKPACFKTLGLRNGFVAYEFAFVNLEMSVDHQRGCMWHVLSSATGFNDRREESPIIVLVSGESGFSDVDIAAILLNEALNFDFATRRDMIEKSIEDLWATMQAQD